MEFDITPFYLYPIEERYMDKLFINRDIELQLIRSILDTSYEDFSEICSIVGDMGEGKSSMLNYAKMMAEDMGYDVGYINRKDDLDKASDLATKNEVVILDDTDTLDDEEIEDFYVDAEDIVQDCKVVMFTDTNRRKHSTLRERDFMVSQEITLPKFQNSKELEDLLRKRMENCCSYEDGFEFPFSEKAVEMSYARAEGNLRAFLMYAENAWKLKGDKDFIDDSIMEKGISFVDRKAIDRLDRNSLKILWKTTDTKLNKSYVAEICGLDTIKLDRRIDGPLKDLTKRFKGKNDIMLSSKYTEVPRGKDILERIYSNMGIDPESLM